MQIGVYCSSKRPYLWGGLYQTLTTNNVNFNLCIAGPNPPIEPLPGNMKYIQTNVKPAQCWFIAAQNTVGDYVMNIPDDMILSHGCLDDMTKLISGDMTISSPELIPHGNMINKKKENHYLMWDARGYVKGDPRDNYTNKRCTGTILPLLSPIPLLSFMRKETFNNIGIDKQYVAMWWNLDMSLELISRGGKIIISENSYGYEFRGGGDKGSLCQIPDDIFYYNDMWIDQAIIGGPDKKVRTTRKEPIDPLVYNETVLTVSQGRVYPPLSTIGTYDAGNGEQITPRWI